MKSGGSGSGSGSGNPPKQPQPAANVTSYGQASPFNPQFFSVLNNEDPTAPARLTDVGKWTSGPKTPLLEAQQAAAEKTKAAQDSGGGAGSVYQQILAAHQQTGGGGRSSPFSALNLPSPGEGASSGDQDAYRNAQKRAMLAAFMGIGSKGGGRRGSGNS